MFTPSAFASFSLIVVNTKDCQFIDNIINIKIPPIITIYISIIVTAKISPNK